MYIVSKASQDNEYIDWEHNVNGSLSCKRSVVIKGAAHVIDKKTLDTVNGVVTEISEEDYGWLKDNAAFKDHVAGGFMFVCDGKKEADKKAEEEAEKDGSGQLTPEDFEKIGQEPPVVDIKTVRKRKK